MVALSAPDWLLVPLTLQGRDVRPVGRGSLTATLVAVLGPALVTTMVFFLLAQDGIRVPLVTGVQTCALPILSVSVSVALLLAALVSLAAVTVTVLANEPVAEA